jgi:hypothetical protein
MPMHAGVSLSKMPHITLYKHISKYTKKIIGGFMDFVIARLWISFIN